VGGILLNVIIGVGFIGLPGLIGIGSPGLAIDQNIRCHCASPFSIYSISSFLAAVNGCLISSGAISLNNKLMGGAEGTAPRPFSELRLVVSTSSDIRNPQASASHSRVALRLISDPTFGHI